MTAYSGQRCDQSLGLPNLEDTISSIIICIHFINSLITSINMARGSWLLLPIFSLLLDGPSSSELITRSQYHAVSLQNTETVAAARVVVVVYFSVLRASAE